MILNPAIATLMTVSVTVISAILVLILIFLIPVLLQVRRTAHEAEKLIDKDPETRVPAGVRSVVLFVVLVYCLRNDFTHLVIPDLIRSPVFSI